MDGWPTLAAARGRVLFFMEGAAVDEYVADAPGLVGRLVFANSQPGDPHAAVMIVNDALVDGATISERVGLGYIVRTLADGSTNEARSGDESRMNAALSSGAQIVSTDYYRPAPRGNTPGPIPYWETGDIASTINELVAAGATERDAVRDVGGGLRVASVTDPAGNVIGLRQPPESNR